MQALKVSEARLTSGLFKERETINREYLMELDNRALLQNFYLEAGILLPGLQQVPDPEDCYLHWGWEAPAVSFAVISWVIGCLQQHVWLWQTRIANWRQSYLQLSMN